MIVPLNSPSRNHKIYPEIVLTTAAFIDAMKHMIAERSDVLMTYHPEHGQMFSQLGLHIRNTLYSKGNPSSMLNYVELTICNKFEGKHKETRLNAADNIATELGNIYSKSENVVEIMELQDQLNCLKGQFTTTDIYKTLKYSVEEFARHALN